MLNLFLLLSFNIIFELELSSIYFRIRNFIFLKINYYFELLNRIILLNTKLESKYAHSN